MSRAIDLVHLGRDRVICAHEIDGAIVDPGPSSCVEKLLEGLGDTEPRSLLLTHIHLDHAGAAGSLARRFPRLTVYVHERGAPHLADPSKLLESASLLYGEEMDRLWGEVAAVPEERIRPLAGGEVVEGFRVAYTPGHASHHVCYLREESGDAYVGDVAGLRIPPFEFTRAPTVPPDLDLEAWFDSLDTVAAWRPERLRLTHFGAVDGVEEQLERVRSALRRAASLAREGNRDSFFRALERDTRSAVDDPVEARLEQAAPLEQLWMGLERYWAKRAEVVA